jgi:hypothetical protein
MLKEITTMCYDEFAEQVIRKFNNYQIFSFDNKNENNRKENKGVFKRKKR